MQIHFPKMKLKNIQPHSLLICLMAMLISSCSGNQSADKKQIGKDENAVSSVLLDTDSLNTLPFVAERVNEIKMALQQPRPVLLCKDSLDQNQLLAQIIALNDSAFTQFLKDPFSHQSYRNEIFGIYPARQSDLTNIKMPFNLASCYRIEMYNYALNNTSIALVDVQQQKTLSSYYLSNTQPDIPFNLRTLAVKIAIESPEVQKALGIKPEEKDALMASTKTALNRTRCERSRHLCVAPTFVKDDKALWAIVDLTDYKLVGIRWTNVGTTGPAAPMVTERRLQDDKITSCYCEIEQSLKKDGWDMKYMLTSSDGLRISDVSFNGKPVLRSAKLVDWHVSYSGTDGFGYSDAVGCPYFSQAAVVAWEIPKVAELKDDNNNTIGFVLEQTFRSEGWPTPCNYNYQQRYEFYNDGKFRIACASIGRGCGNTGTYRPVFRIAFTGEQNNFYQWNNNSWEAKQNEFWNEQTSLSQFTPEHYMYKISSAQNGYYIEPGQGQFNDGGRGDFSYIYVTKNIPGREEGENDLPTIGPCCNTDYHQGPEKFIEPTPDNIQNASLVIWYVAQLRNDDRKGNEYCWAENVLENGIWKTKVYPCFAGPVFVPVK
jgi:Copper amine oxidase, enzyme domain